MSFTKTETIRRLRVAAQLVRESDRNIAKNFRVELGSRFIPVYAATAAAAEAAWRRVDASMADDLDDFSSLVDHDQQARIEGYVAHLYFSSTGDWGELYDVRTVWLGTADSEPEVIG